MKMTRETADAITDLMRIPQFETFVDWIDELDAGFTAHAIAGISDELNTTPDVLRGRAQAIQIIKQQMGKAPEIVSRIKVAR